MARKKARAVVAPESSDNESSDAESSDAESDAEAEVPRRRQRPARQQPCISVGKGRKMRPNKLLVFMRTQMGGVRAGSLAPGARSEMYRKWLEENKDADMCALYASRQPTPKLQPVKTKGFAAYYASTGAPAGDAAAIAHAKTEWKRMSDTERERFAKVTKTPRGALQPRAPPGFGLFFKEYMAAQRTRAIARATEAAAARSARRRDAFMTTCATVGGDKCVFRDALVEDEEQEPELPPLDRRPTDADRRGAMSAWEKLGAAKRELYELKDRRRIALPPTTPRALRAFHAELGGRAKLTLKEARERWEKLPPGFRTYHESMGGAREGTTEEAYALWQDLPEEAHAEYAEQERERPAATPRKLRVATPRGFNAFRKQLTRDAGPGARITSKQAEDGWVALSQEKRDEFARTQPQTKGSARAKAKGSAAPSVTAATQKSLLEAYSMLEDDDGDDDDDFSAAFVRYCVGLPTGERTRLLRDIRLRRTSRADVRAAVGGGGGARPDDVLDDMVNTVQTRAVAADAAAGGMRVMREAIEKGARVTPEAKRAVTALANLGTVNDAALSAAATEEVARRATAVGAAAAAASAAAAPDSEVRVNARIMVDASAASAMATVERSLEVAEHVDASVDHLARSPAVGAATADGAARVQDATNAQNAAAAAAVVAVTDVAEDLEPPAPAVARASAAAGGKYEVRHEKLIGGSRARVYSAFKRLFAGSKTPYAFCHDVELGHKHWRDVDPKRAEKSFFDAYIAGGVGVVPTHNRVCVAKSTSGRVVGFAYVVYRGGRIVLVALCSSGTPGVGPLLLQHSIDAARDIKEDVEREAASDAEPITEFDIDVAMTEKNQAGKWAFNKKVFDKFYRSGLEQIRADGGLRAFEAAARRDGGDGAEFRILL
jgi:hypothetical protein